jgi:hypothetical protein
MYGCRPSELDEEDWYTVLCHRAIKSAEGDYLRAEARANADYERVRYRAR